MSHNPNKFHSSESPATAEELEMVALQVDAVWTAVNQGRDACGMEVSSDGVIARLEWRSQPNQQVILYRDYDHTWIFGQEVFMPGSKKDPINSVNRTITTYPLSMDRSQTVALENGRLEGSNFIPTRLISEVELGPISSQDCQQIRGILARVNFY